MNKTAFSFSALSTFETCPKKYWHLYVQKDIKDEDSEAAAEGRFIHEALYKRVIKGVALPLSLRPYEKWAKRFAEAKGEKDGEMKLALDQDLQPCTWFDKRTRVRAIVDLLIRNGNRAVLIDYKTGKPKEDFTQMGLAAAVLSRYAPEIEIIDTVYVWLQHDKVSKKTYTLSKLVDVWNDLLPRADKIDAAKKTTSFPARQSGLCGWCPVRICPHYAPRS